MAKGYRFASVVSMAVLDSLDRTSSNGRLLPASDGQKPAQNGWFRSGPSRLSLRLKGIYETRCDSSFDRGNC